MGVLGGSGCPGGSGGGGWGVSGLGGPGGAALTSVRTSSTDLKSLDIEASLDWGEGKGMGRGGQQGGGVGVPVPPPPHPPSPPHLQRHHDALGVGLEVAAGRAPPRPHQLLQLRDLLVQAVDVLGGGHGPSGTHPAAWAPPRPPRPPPDLLDDVGQLLDLQRFVVEERLALGHCGGGTGAWGEGTGGDKQGGHTEVGEGLRAPSCPPLPHSPPHSRIVSFSSLAKVLLRSRPMRLGGRGGSEVGGRGELSAPPPHCPCAHPPPVIPPATQGLPGGVPDPPQLHQRHCDPP